MHALRKFIQDRMDARQWRQADLVRASGLSKHLVQQLLKDDREVMTAAPSTKTAKGIARAFSVPESAVTAAVFEAMSYDLGDARVVDLSAVPSSELLRALGKRLGVGDEQVGDHDDEPHYTVRGEPGDRFAGSGSRSHSKDGSEPACSCRAGGRARGRVTG